jgi:hypothetical protein
MRQLFHNEDEITPQIYFIREQRVMLDSDLALIYGIGFKNTSFYSSPKPLSIISKLPMIRFNPLNRRCKHLYFRTQRNSNIAIARRAKNAAWRDKNIGFVQNFIR